MCVLGLTLIQKPETEIKYFKILYSFLLHFICFVFICTSSHLSHVLNIFRLNTNTKVLY